MQAVTQGRVLRGTAAYTVTAALQRGISFILLPVFARVLSPAEFGQIGIITTVSGAVVAVLGFGLESAIVRTLVQLRDRPAEARRFLNTVGVFAVAVPPMLGLLVSMPIGLALQAAYGIPVWWVALGIVGGALGASVTAVVFAVLRAEERLRDYVRLGIVQVTLVAALPLWLVVALDAGVGGWFAASVVGGVVVLAIGLALGRHRFSLDADRRYLVAALAFGIPMIPHVLSHWGLALSDRLLLGSLATTTDVGVYHVAYQFGLPIALVAAAMAQSTQPMYAEASVGRSEAVFSDLKRLSTYVVLGICLLGVSVGLLGPPLLELLLPADYGAGSSLIPWIALGTVLYGCYFVPMNSITMLAGRNRWVWVITALAATTNVVLNLLLIPSLGVTAAAINTAIGYAVLLAGVIGYARHVAPDGPFYETSRIGLGALILAIPTLLLAVGGEPLVILVIRATAIASIVVVLFATGLFPRSIGRIAWGAVPGAQPE